MQEKLFKIDLDQVYLTLKALRLLGGNRALTKLLKQHERGELEHSDFVDEFQTRRNSVVTIGANRISIESSINGKRKRPLTWVK